MIGLGKADYNGEVNLNCDGGLWYCLFDEGEGGVDSNHTIIMCENNKKSNKIAHCFKDMGFFAIDR